MRIRPLPLGFIVTFLAIALPWGSDLSAGPAAQKPRVVIDAGHGGKDPGAIGRGGIREKQIALEISRRIAAALSPDAQVTFTRSSDRFVSLEGRGQIARKHSCDLFLSVHANASRRRSASGVEIYYLNNATDEASSRLADRENAGSPRKGAGVDAVLSQLIQNASVDEAADVAAELQKSIGRGLKSYGVRPAVKTALFYVLMGNRCPSLLVESGFVTNAAEAKRLRTAAYQEKLAASVAAGIRAYWANGGMARGDL